MGAADQESQLMKLVHEEMSQFFDVVNEKEFKEVVEKYPNSRWVVGSVSSKGVKDISRCTSHGTWRRRLKNTSFLGTVKLNNVL